MKAIVNGIILAEKGEIRGKALLFDEKLLGIVALDEVRTDEVIDARGQYVAPGLIDVHIHGYWGEDTSDGSEEGVRKLAKGILRNGVTSFLPTTMTVSWHEIEAAFDTVRRLKPLSRTAGFDGSEILGCHAEGPFINPRRKGAQAAHSTRVFFDSGPKDGERQYEQERRTQKGTGSYYHPEAQGR